MACYERGRGGPDIARPPRPRLFRARDPGQPVPVTTLPPKSTAAQNPTDGHETPVKP